MRLVDWIRKLMWRILGDPPDPPALRIGKTYLVFPALETPLSLEAGRLYYRSIGGRAVPYTQDGSQEYEVGSILSQQKIIPPSAGADALVIRSYDDSIDRLKILEDGSIITGTGTVGKLDSATGVLELAKLKMTGDLDMGGYVAKNLGAPVDPNDSARKSDVDTVQSNLDTHRTSIPIDHPDGSITDEKIAEMSRTKLKPPVLEGLIADRPSAGVAGRIYIATDERKVYRDTGTAWEEITAVERLADHEAKKTDVHGVASPDEIAGKSYVDDSISAHEGKALDGVHKVLTGNEADMPPAGEAGRIYIATDTLKIFRDTGTEWKELTAVGRLNTHEGKNTGVHGAGANYLAYASVSDYIADTELSNHEGKSTGVHGVGSSYICKTSRSDQLPSWGDIPDKPSQFPPEPHASSHAVGGADEIPDGGLNRAKIGDFWNSPFWDNIPDKPSSFPPEPHTHPISDITDIINIAELRRDTSANRPTAGTAGRIFFETDTKRVLFDDGSAWLQLGVAKWDNLEGKPSQFPPEPHASSHRVGGADQLFDQNLNTTDSVKFANLEVSENINAGIITHFGAWGSEPAIPRLNNVLALADRRFTVTVSATPTSGSVSNMFDHSFETSARWNTTVTYPVTIEIDFGATYHYFTKIGVYFIYGRYAGYVKIEVYRTDTSAWQTLKEVSGNKGTHVYWIGGQRYVGKIRITIDEPTANPYDEIAIALIYAESSALYKVKGGGHPHFPNLMINGAEVITPDRVLQNITKVLTPSVEWGGTLKICTNESTSDSWVEVHNIYPGYKANLYVEGGIGVRTRTMIEGGWGEVNALKGLYANVDRNSVSPVRIYGIRADDTNTLRNSGALELVGAYWDGEKSVDRLAKIFHRMIETTPKSEFVFQIAGNDYFAIGDNGVKSWKSIIPSSDNAYDLGSSSYRWANVYGVNVYASSVYSGLLRGTDVYASNVYASAKVKVGDLEFENKWKFTEHPKYGIVLVSPKGKKYRLVLEEIAE